MDGLTPLLRVLAEVYPAAPLPLYVRLLTGVKAVRSGALPEEACSQRGALVRLKLLLASPDPVAAMFGHGWNLQLDQETVAKAYTASRKNIGQLFIGRVAERAFETIYKREIGTEDLTLEDDRSGRNETDYRILNGQGRRVFRINIKTHGSPFRRAKDLVGLDPSDCFALATYKIWQGLNKEAKETLPYLFVVVTAFGLSGELVGEAVPEDVARLLTLVRLGQKVPELAKRDVEDRCVSYLLGPGAPADFVEHRTRIVDQFERETWRIVSATKADKLLRERLFDRVYAVRVPRFAQNYRRAELDMHFSLSEDLTPLTEFLRIYKAGGLHAITAHLARGLI